MITELQYASLVISLSTLGQVDISSTDPEQLDTLAYLLEEALKNVRQARATPDVSDDRGAQLLVEHTAYRVALGAARHALLSYAYGNSASGPALDTAEYIEETLEGRGRAIDDARKARAE